VSIQKGRYGAFIKYGKENLKIPKDVDYNDLTIQQIEVIAKAAQPEDKKKGAKKTTAVKKTVTAKKAAPKKAVASKTGAVRKVAAKKK
jgi:DNA topoisomerase-1